MKLKKFLALALAVTTVLSMSVLTGCSSKKEETSAKETTAETTAETGAEGEEAAGAKVDMAGIKIGFTSFMMRILLMIRTSSMLPMPQRKLLVFLMSRLSLKPIFLKAANVMKPQRIWLTADVISCLPTALDMNSTLHRQQQNSRKYSSAMQQEQPLTQQVWLTSTMLSHQSMKAVTSQVLPQA